MEISFEEFEPEFMSHFDGYVPICVVVEDNEFIQRHMMKIEESDQIKALGVSIHTVLDTISRDMGECSVRKTARVEMIEPSMGGTGRFYRCYTIPGITDEQAARLSEWAIRAGWWWKNHMAEQDKNISDEYTTEEEE